KAANLTSEDCVFEIGPGKGILTKIIAPIVNNLTTVEIDKTLFSQLSAFFSFHNQKNIDLINADILKFDIPADKSFKFISNLPYNIGTAIIQKLLPLPNWTSAVFMLQKEVAHRIISESGSKDYGYLSIFCSYYAESELLFDVSPSCFNPKPKVVSSVIKFTNKKAPPPDDDFFKLVKFCFSMRRKTILNSLSSFTELEKNKTIEILKSCSINEMLRPDKLSVFHFLILTKALKKYKIITDF
ncbi:MAG: 16S rRNA (adenine(1518)-N(6)/adenine(1519)-N(6))-dimethyltransferase RsmA, partial [Elusimicrobiota bacterium]|nr:16S rRNA (adenine(1518)-N(6)/adenine(1519)-N(6))-dimethyltransferase RsmA [Elusimicrobiota bacterium]